MSVIAADQLTPIAPSGGVATATGWALVAIVWLGAAVIGAGMAHALSSTGGGRSTAARFMELLVGAGFLIGGLVLTCWLGDTKLPISVTTVALVAAAEGIATAALIVWLVRVGPRTAHKQ